MSSGVQSIGTDSNSVRSQQTVQEQLLQMQEVKDGKTQENGTRVEDSTAVSASASKTDTIEISAEGQAALEQIKAAKSNSSSAPATTAQTSSAKTSTAASTTSSLETTDSSSDITKYLDENTVSTSDLYTKSESELKSLVSEGEITNQQMQDELARRGQTA